MKVFVEDLHPGDLVEICVPETLDDARTAVEHLSHYRLLALDTESTSFKGMYRPDWKLRLVQFGTTEQAWVLPVDQFEEHIGHILCQPDRQYILHNVPHDLLSLDLYYNRKAVYDLGSDLFPRCIDTHILAHLLDSRPSHEGGLGLGLKDLAQNLFNVDAGKWERELKEAFKQLKVEIPGETYKSGKRKGQQKYRKAHLQEGWRLIPSDDPAYLRYSGMDVILESRVYEALVPRLRSEYGEELSLQATGVS